MINEIHAQPNATAGDANGDGVINANDDEFVELVNSNNFALDISGFRLLDGAAVRHTFPSGTVLGAGCAIVVFGGGTPMGAFGGAIVQTATIGQLNLGNSNDTVTLQDAILNVSATYTYGAEANSGQSLTRSPDITGPNPLVQHLNQTASGTRFSPGTKFDGTAFACVAPPSPTPSPTPTPTPFNNSVFISHSIPAKLAAGQAIPVRITMSNTGDTIWTTPGNYSLAVTNDPCAMSASSRIGLPVGAVIDPGENVNFDFTMTPGATPGFCNFSVQMIQEFVEFFGPTIPFQPEIVPATNDAQFVSNTIPPVFEPNQVFNVGISIRNLGSKAWFTGSNHGVRAISDSCGLFGGTTTPVGDPTAMILTNQTFQFIVFMEAPATTGPCSFQLQMTETGPGDFGQIFSGQIQVQPLPNAARDWEAYE